LGQLLELHPRRTKRAITSFYRPADYLRIGAAQDVAHVRAGFARGFKMADMTLMDLTVTDKIARADIGRDIAGPDIG